MDKSVKVTKGLACCQECDGCTCRNVCPYHDGKEPENQPTCTCRLARDALDVIRAKDEEISSLKAALTPRVLTLEEIEAYAQNAGNAKMLEQRPLFLERKPFVKEALNWRTENEVLNLFFQWAFRREYGKTFRYWTNQPTDDQREAVKWE